MNATPVISSFPFFHHSSISFLSLPPFPYSLHYFVRHVLTNCIGRERGRLLLVGGGSRTVAQSLNISALLAVHPLSASTLPPTSPRDCFSPHHFCIPDGLSGHLRICIAFKSKRKTCCQLFSVTHALFRRQIAMPVCFSVIRASLGYSTM